MAENLASENHGRDYDGAKCMYPFIWVLNIWVRLTEVPGCPMNANRQATHWSFEPLVMTVSEDAASTRSLGTPLADQKRYFLSFVQSKHQNIGLSIRALQNCLRSYNAECLDQSFHPSP